MKWAPRLLAILAVLAAVLLTADAALDYLMDQPSGNTATVRIQVPRGEGLHELFDQLQRRGLMRHTELIALYLRLRGQTPRIEAGTYDIPAHSSARALLRQLAEGRVVLDQLTIIEGWDVEQMRQSIDADPDLTHQLRGLSNAQLMSALGHPGQPAEGRFFPDTYRFAAGTSDGTILQMAYRRMQRELAQAWASRAPGLAIHSARQALILASMIEKETGRADERARIAAVFMNRLRRGMRLQSDPTVIYGLGSRYDGTIHTRDLLTATPYNTYTRAGLPPTPICLPGAASLDAAVHPAQTADLYFVATGKGDGSHAFSATLAGHDRDVRAYLRRLDIRPARARRASPAASTQRGRRARQQR